MATVCGLAQLSDAAFDRKGELTVDEAMFLMISPPLCPASGCNLSYAPILKPV